jgi:DNA-binding response OmpR family regulator
VREPASPPVWRARPTLERVPAQVETNQRIASMPTDEKMLRVADVVMDVQNHTVTRGEKQPILNRKEFTLRVATSGAGGMAQRAKLSRHFTERSVNRSPQARL